MRRGSILFVNQHYWPDHLATSLQLSDLAEHLAAGGYEVTVWCSRPQGVTGLPAAEVRHGVRVERIQAQERSGDSAIARIVHYAGFYWRVLLRLLLGRRFDLVITLTTPPMIGTAAFAASRVRRFVYGIWSMDLHPDAEFAAGMVDPTSFQGRFLKAVNSRAERGAEFVVALGSCMNRRLLGHGLDPRRLHVIPVWSRGDQIQPIAAEENPLRCRLGLAGKFVVMYSGNAGVAHCFDEVLDAMLRLRDHEQIAFLFVGGGPHRAQIEDFINSHELQNALYVDYLPREELCHSLPLGDVHLITLRTEMTGIAVPSKIYGIMAAGRPTIMIGAEDSEPARIILRESIGEVIAPAHESGGKEVADAILKLYSMPHEARQMGERARRAFEARYDRPVACGQWLELVDIQLGSTADTLNEPEEAHV